MLRRRDVRPRHRQESGFELRVVSNCKEPHIDRESGPCRSEVNARPRVRLFASTAIVLVLCCVSGAAVAGLALALGRGPLFAAMLYLTLPSILYATFLAAVLLRERPRKKLVKSAVDGIDSDVTGLASCAFERGRRIRIRIGVAACAVITTLFLTDDRHILTGVALMGSAAILLAVLARRRVLATYATTKRPRKGRG